MESVIENIYSKFISADQTVCTDTRKISAGCLFFALRGENFNGNDFAIDSIKKGAGYAIVDDENFKPDERLIVVHDVLKTLQQLATFHRRQLKTKMIALTGSNGKTTTKELINAVLSQKFNTHATQGNLNNHIGVPLTLLSLKSSHEIAVIEMGANHQKEIELLSKIAEPDFGLITNIGKAHLEGFGGIEGVKKGKGELYDYLKKTNGKIFLHADDAILNKLCGDYASIITYGSSKNFDFTGTIEESKPFLQINWYSKNNSEKEIVSSNLTGNYNFENILAAVCIGKYFGVEKEGIKKGIENYVPSNQRSQVVKKNSNTFILDYYNANPSSMEAALLNFEKNYSEKKIAILGDMLELGDESEREHLNIIELLKKLNVEEIILVGKNFNQFSNKLNPRKGSNLHFLNNSDEANTFIQKQNFLNASILIKGSRGLKMEKIMEAF
ncbi:MAG: UDP-N-acetylmuramoyl-tripeptide--D-alanyl-D-alanine ligase [Bacteroidia bacterium]